MTQLFVILALLVIGVASLVGVYVLVELPGWLARRQLDPPTSVRRRIGAPRARANGAADRDLAWLSGKDLLDYPQRVAVLEEQLSESLRATGSQAAHLRERRAELAHKEGRTELVGRYAEDAAMLERRAASMRRVLGLVWKTRAVLTLRAHVAITARRRPQLDGLPVGPIKAVDLEAAAVTYRDAAASVRAFVDEVRARRRELDGAVPERPEEAEVADLLLRVIEDEHAGVAATHERLGAEMDLLADKLDYLAERCRTRRVVEGAPAGLEAESGSEEIFDEVNRALNALGDLAQLGDQHLADAALDNLAEDISQLERAGLEAQAEAEAAEEVAKLLEQFEQQPG